MACNAGEGVNIMPVMDGMISYGIHHVYYDLEHKISPQCTEKEMADVDIVDICKSTSLIINYILTTHLSNIIHPEIMDPISKIIKTVNNMSFIFITPEKVIKICYFPDNNYLKEFINEVNIHLYINTIQKDAPINCFIKMWSVRFFKQNSPPLTPPVLSTPRVSRIKKIAEKIGLRKPKPETVPKPEPVHTICLTATGYHADFVNQIHHPIYRSTFIPDTHRVGFIYLEKATDICEYIKLYIQHINPQLIIEKLIESFYNLIKTFSKSAKEFLLTPLDGVTHGATHGGVPAQIHNHFFTHNDIKLDNIMISTDTHILKLIDFGQSKLQDTFHNINIKSNPNQVKWLFKDAPDFRKESFKYLFSTSSLLFDIFQIIITLLILLLWVLHIFDTKVKTENITYKEYINYCTKNEILFESDYYLLRKMYKKNGILKDNQLLHKLINLSDIIYLYYNSLKFEYMSRIPVIIDHKQHTQHHINEIVYTIEKFTIDIIISRILHLNLNQLTDDHLKHINHVRGINNQHYITYFKECQNILADVTSKYIRDWPIYNQKITIPSIYKFDNHEDVLRAQRNFRDISHVTKIIDYILDEQVNVIYLHLPPIRHLNKMLVSKLQQSRRTDHHVGTAPLL